MQVISINKNPSKKGAHDGGWRKEVMRENTQQRERGRVGGREKPTAYRYLCQRLKSNTEALKTPEFEDLACAC
jgi:hypothetical protein